MQKGYQVIALEPAHRIYEQLSNNFAGNPAVTTLKLAVSDIDDSIVNFYEADEDGLSTLNKDWLTKESLPYAGKNFRTINARTITIDTLAKRYGEPDLIKIDVEGAEWFVFRGMTRKYGVLTFEWTIQTIDEHNEQLKYLKSLGYQEFAPQFIEHHLQEPDKWYSLDNFNLDVWVQENKEQWETNDWKKSNLRPTADVGMCWVR